MPIHIHPIATKDVEVTIQRNSNAEYEYYNNTQNIKDTPKCVHQLDEYIVEDASDEENEDDNSTVSSFPDFTPIEMFPTSDTAYSTPKRVHQLDEYIVEDASDEENEDDNSTGSSQPDFTPIEMFPTSDTSYSDKVVGGHNVTVEEASSTTTNIKDTPKFFHQLDDYIVEDASDEENEDNNSTGSSQPDFTPIEMFPTSDTAYSDKVVGGHNVTVEEASSTTTNMHRQKTLKEEDAKKDEEANNIIPKKRGRPKSGRATYNKKGKLNLEPF